MTKELMLCWQDPVIRQWLVVGRLKYINGEYEFSYTKDAHKASLSGIFLPFKSMSDLDRTYVSEQLFPFFKNRLLAKSRPEYPEYLGWLGLNKEQTNDMEELARSGGVRMTDQLQLIPYPEKDQGFYNVQFFAHGLIYTHQQVNGRFKDLKTGDALYLMRDISNKVNPLALAIRTDDPLAVVGYCPDVLVNDLNKLIDAVGVDHISVSVLRVNLDAPWQFLLQCQFRCQWMNGFKPFGSAENLPLAKETQ